MRSRKKTQSLPRKSPGQARAQRTVDAILEAAARILREHGPAALNTNAIAARAGVSVGSLYEYFPSKEAILVGLARHQLESDRVAMTDTLTSTAGKSLDHRVREAVRTLIHLHVFDEDVRRVTMRSHLEHGFWAEHEGPVQAVAEALATSDEVFKPLSSVARFVLTRAAVGVVRAACREQPELLREQAMEDALARLILAFLTAP